MYRLLAAVGESPKIPPPEDCQAAQNGGALTPRDRFLASNRGPFEGVEIPPKRRRLAGRSCVG